MFKILHISDFHYKDPKSGDFNEVASRLRKSVKNQDFDLVVFSGDLVFEGKDRKDFEEAYDLLLKPILEDKGFGIDRLMLAPGNHDLCRDQEISVIRKTLDRISDEPQLNEFLSDKRQSDASFENFKNYNEFIGEIYKDLIYSDNFLNVSKTLIKGKVIGKININSAWRSYNSKIDRGNLLFPPEKLSEAFYYLDKCDIILCNMHHSLSDFKDFIEQSIDDIIYDKCDLLFTGHYHKNYSGSLSGNSIGILHNRASAVYNRKDPLSKYGYCIIEYNYEELEADIKRFYYIDKKYIPYDTQHHEIPVDDERHKMIDFRKTMRKREREFIKKADDIFVAGRGKIDGKTTFLELFTEPVLRPKSFRDYFISKSKGELVTSEMITNSTDDYIIYGLDKCGKTSLLWKILINTIHNYFQLRTIPYYVNCKEVKFSLPKPIMKEMPQYIEMNKADVENVFQKYSILLLLDNFKLNDENHKNWLIEQIKDFPNIRIIVTTEETILTDSEELILDDRSNPQHLFFHEITYKEIHQLSGKWPNLTPEKRISIEKRINQVFRQMHIPFNYWTASLFMWIFEKTDEANIHNNFELVRYYIEELLNRKSILLDHSLNIQYEDLESYLGALAYFLLQHYEDNYTISYSDLISFSEDYGKRKKKFTDTPKNVVDYLINNGTIYEKISDRFTFRLKGVWEYFLAYHMKENEYFRNKVIEDLTYYLSFGNEMELYAGFCRNDISFVKKIFNQTRLITDPVFKNLDNNKVDDKLINQLSNKLTVRDIAKIVEKSDILDQGDEGNDELIIVAQPFENKEVELKKKYDYIDPIAVNIQKALFILGRVFRNSLACDEEKLGEEILNFVLNGVCNLGFMIHDEFRINIKDEDSKKLVEGLGAMLPIIMQTYLFDMMCQKSLARVFEEKLSILLEKPQNNQFRIFLLAACLLDLDIERYFKYLEPIEKILKKGALRFSALLKAEFLYTKEEKMSNTSRNALRKFITMINQEMVDKKEEVEERIRQLDKKRETQLQAIEFIVTSR